MSDEKEVIDKLVEDDRTDPSKFFSFNRRNIQRLGQGLHNGQFYYGVNTQKGEVGIVTSDKKFYIRSVVMEKDEKGKLVENIIDDIKVKFNLNYQHPFDEDCVDYPWKQKKIHNFLTDSYQKPTLKKIIDNIYEINKEFIEHIDDETHMYIACFTLATYCYTLFESIGRLLYNALQGSGKSKQARLNKLMCFNAMWFTKGSESSAIRSLEASAGVPIVDNYDKLHDELKKQIDHLVETGMYEDAKYRLSDKNTHKQTSFRVYSPLIINNIVGLDVTTIDKTFEVKMMKTIGKIKTKKPDTKDPRFEQIRNECRLYVLDNWETIKKMQEHVNLSDMDGRFADVVRAPLTIARLYGKLYFDKLKLYCLKIEKEMQEKTSDDDWNFVLFNQLKEEINGKDSWVSVKQISEKICPSINPWKTWKDKYGNDNDDEVDKKKCITQICRYVGKTLRNTAGFRKSKTVHGKRHYFILNDVLNKYIKIRNYEMDTIDIDLSKNSNLCLPTSPTSPISPKSTYVTQKKGELGELGELGDIKNESNTFCKISKKILNEITEKGERSHNDLVNFCVNVRTSDGKPFTNVFDEVLEKMLTQGLIFQTKPGVYRRV